MKIVYPIKSEQLFNGELQTIKRNIDEKFIRKRRDLFNEMLLANGLDNDSKIFDYMDKPGVSEIFEQYDRSVVSIEQENEKEYANTIGKMNWDYDNQKRGEFL